METADLVTFTEEYLNGKLLFVQLGKDSELLKSDQLEILALSKTTSFPLF